MFPTITEYNQVIKGHGIDAFKTLHNLTFIPSRTLPVKIYSYGSGSYAVVFKAKDQYKEYAIRCFISAEKETLNRYRSISRYLKNIDATWYCGLEILENEIDVHGRYYPVIKMDWINGKLLNNYVSDILQHNAAINALQEEIIKVSESLERNCIGHGDIQCGNVLVTKNLNGNPVLKLIDYDGLYIPEFASKSNLEHGRSEFQHPKRTQALYNEKIDRFSFWVLVTALEALKYDKSLWLEVMQGGFNTLDNFLFTGDDFKNFRSSKLVQRLYALNRKPLTFYLDKLNSFCNASPADVEAVVLFNDSIKENAPKTGKLIFKEGKSEFQKKFNINSNTYTTVRDEGSEIQIITTPTGAAVLTSTFERLGNTPLTINKAKYLNKTLIVSYGTQIKQTEILQHTSIVDITFPEKKNPVGTREDLIRNYKHPSRRTSRSRTEPNPAPAINNSVSNTTQVKSKPDYVLWIATTVLVLIIPILMFVEYYENSNVNNQNEELETIVDETIFVDSSIVDSEVYGLDTTALPSSYILEERVVTPLVLVSSTDEYEQTANQVVWRFFDALNRQDCKLAWGLTYIDYWEKEGENSFCSLDGYGGISKAHIGEFSSVNKTDSEMLFKVRYYVFHNRDGSLYYDVYIKLNKIQSSENKLHWFITDIYDV